MCSLWALGSDLRSRSGGTITPGIQYVKEAKVRTHKVNWNKGELYHNNLLKRDRQIPYARFDTSFGCAEVKGNRLKLNYPNGTLRPGDSSGRDMFTSCGWHNDGQGSITDILECK